MIIDSSVVVALAVREPLSQWISTTLAGYPDEDLFMSWVNVAEASIAVARESVQASEALEPTLVALGIELLDTDFSIVQVVTEARYRFPINFGDCFAYAHAKLRNELLLTLDADFLKTDLERVLHPKRRR